LDVRLASAGSDGMRPCMIGRRPRTKPKRCVRKLLRRPMLWRWPMMQVHQHIASLRRTVLARR
jgi:hypothetical protein